MTIEEAIEHCKEVEKEKRNECAECMDAQNYRSAEECNDCAEEHKQLAEWLIELKQRREAEISEKPKTNGDRIRQMTDDEELLSAIGTGCYRCAYSNGECDSGYGKGCIAGNLEWLKQEVQNNDG